MYSSLDLVSVGPLLCAQQETQYRHFQALLNSHTRLMVMYVHVFSSLMT